MIDKVKKRRKQKRYPWDRWFATKGPFRLNRGREFKVATYSMAQQIRNAAAKQGKFVSIKINEKSLVVEVLHQYEASSYGDRAG